MESWHKDYLPVRITKITRHTFGYALIMECATHSFYTANMPTLNCAQENRLAAHFAPGENGERVRRMYNENPYLDEHQYAAEVSGLIEEYGAKVGRKFAKNLRFGLCLSSDTFYQTTEGSYRGTEIVSRRKSLMDLQGNKQGYDAFLFRTNGLEFELSNGVKITSTLEHMFIDCESTQWRTKSAKDVKVGDRLPLKKCTVVHNGVKTVKAGNNEYLFDKGMAYLAGLYLGDGSAVSTVSLITHKVNTPFVESVLMEKGFGYRVSDYQGKIDRMAVYKEAKPFFTLFGTSTHNKRIPDFVYSSDTEIQLSFIAGLIDSDGCITKYSARLMGCNEKLMRDEALLLSILGMNCHWSVCHHKETEKLDEYCVDIHCTGGHKIPSIYRKVVFAENADYCGWKIPTKELETFREPKLYLSNPKLYDYLRGKNGLYSHNSWLPEGVWQKDYMPVTVVSIKPVADAEFTYLETDSHYYVADGIATHNCYGMSIARMVINFGWTKEFAEDLNQKIADAAPWLYDLMEAIQQIVTKRRYIRTLIGRRIHLRKGHDNEAYAFMNYLIQGSASDMTKLASVEVWNTHSCELMNLTVHDEDDFSLPCNKAGIKRALEISKIMETTAKVDVPMLSEPEVGTNWSNGVEYDPAFGTREEFITSAVTAIKENRWEEYRKNAKAFLKREEDDDMTFAEFCQSMEEEGEEN